MPNDLTGFKTALKAAQDQALAECIAGEDNAVIRQNYADNYADAVLSFNETLDLTIPIGGIQVTGTAAAQSNASPLVIDNGLS